MIVKRCSLKNVNDSEVNFNTVNVEREENNDVNWNECTINIMWRPRN
jgi:hypothetical protein